MSRYTLEEEEQIASLKAFWAKYGNFILTVLIIVFGAFAANNGWKWWQARSATQAVVPYEKLEKALDKGDLTLAQQIQNSIADEHKRSPYAPRGAMMLSKALFDQGKVTEAKTQLQWVVDHSSLDEYTAGASLMLSAILLDEKQYDQALALLSKDYPGFAGLFHDRKGDIALARNDTSTARTEYGEALKKIQADSPWKTVIERKLAALPAAQPATGEQSK
ncbi:MAG: YfgM family protein [Limnobacter sp.]|uniref:YfgM family protein n=1 Tax=Limnobacter sp. TaxID=2003368 RepID=UPI00391B7425